jgi:hypothetical protein
LQERERQSQRQPEKCGRISPYPLNSVSLAISKEAGLYQLALARSRISLEVGFLVAGFAGASSVAAKPEIA